MLKHNKTFSQHIFHDIVKYIDDRLPYMVSIDELQQKSGYSKRHLNRLFLKHTRVPPSLYLKVMRAYRMLLELKFTTISVEDICAKYHIRDVRNFKETHGISHGGARQQWDIHFRNILKKNKVIFPKLFSSSSFVSLFDYNIQAQGVKYSFQRSGKLLMTSHHKKIEDIIRDFCETHGIHRDKIWSCVKFSPFDNENYVVTLYPCVVNSPVQLPEGETVSLQGDYICFTWYGRPENPFSRVRNFYDVFFLQYKAKKKEGYDILMRTKMEGFNNYYEFNYYIPVAIDEAILSVTR
ncbi:hypothetical protein ACUUMB_23430 [Enterobacter kobei]